MKIALCGIAGSGKDYLADWLVQEQSFTKIAFADSVRKITHDLFPFIDEHYDAHDKEMKLPCGYSPRDVWIGLSNELRKYDNEIFLRHTAEKIKMTHVDNIVVTDLRDIIEYEWLEKNGYTIILIERTDKIYEPNDYDKKILQFVDKIKFVFTNDAQGTTAFNEFLRNSCVLK